MEKLKAGVLGSTGLVGQQFVRMLDAHPYFELEVLTSSSQSAGKKYGQAVKWLVGGEIPEYARERVISETALNELVKRDIDIVFSALPAPAADNIEIALAGEGLSVFSNARTHRMNPDVPVLIPEVNPEHLELVKKGINRRKGFIVTNSNCSTTGLVLGLRPLVKFGIKAVSVTTFQALSGAGRRGVASVDILGNIIPYIKDEEEKIEKETVKILGRLKERRIVHTDIEVNATCCRVPVRDGHLESVQVDLNDDVDVETLTDVLSSFRGLPQDMGLPTAPETPIIVRHEVNRPQPLLDVYAGTPERAKGMAVTIGRIRRKDRKVNFLLLVHNTIRGAAGTCILNAEMAFMGHYLK